MKCIEFYRQHGGYVARVGDEEAAREVANLKAFYVPKRVWKNRKAEGMGEAAP